ncbi:MAG: hypothetical protein V1711_03225 [bacterium]
MSPDYEVSVEQEIADVKMGRPHVIVLGAGASVATCPKGDKNGKALPLMSNFADVVGLKRIIQGWGANPEQNFEEIFSDLYERKESEKIAQIEKVVEEYFDQLELPDKPTVYDHLVLSLREKDLIATFNWDPLLMHAYLRNGKAGLRLPRLVFLHGNVRVGYCEKHRVSGLANQRCKECGQIYKRVPLLYPIKKKDYAEDFFIASEWKQLKWGFENAFMITIFGYSGPKTDQEAIGAMKEAWGDKNQRSMEQTTFITTQSDDEVSENWEPFIHTHHYEVDADFYNSWIANHPRRTGEAYLNQYLEAKFIDNNPIPRGLDFPELWGWYERFKDAEKKL